MFKWENWFTWKDWRLAAIAGALVLVGIVALAVMAKEGAEGGPDTVTSPVATQVSTPAPTAIATQTISKSTPVQTAEAWVLPKLPVSRDEVVEAFEEVFGFQFMNEVNTGLLAGILGVAPVGDAELSLTGKPDHLSTVNLYLNIESEEEAALASLYILGLMEVIVPAWTGGPEWFEDVSKEIGGIQSMETFVANPEPGIEVSMLAIPPPPGLHISLQIAAYD